MKERYRIENKYNLGHQGRLIDAHDTKLNKKVLCRRVDAVSSDDSSAIDQVNFFSDMGAVKHPCTIEVIDRHHDQEAGAWYLVSEWIEGDPLSDWVTRTWEPVDASMIERFIERILGWMTAWEECRDDCVSINQQDIAVVYKEGGKIDFKVISGRPSSAEDSLRSFQRLLGWILAYGRDGSAPMPDQIHQIRPDIPPGIVQWAAWLQCSASEGGASNLRDAWMRYDSVETVSARKFRSLTAISMVVWTTVALFLLGLVAALFWALPQTPESAVPAAANGSVK